MFRLLLSKMTAIQEIKTEYACPFSVPCDCGWACKSHLSDHFVKEGKITCNRCSKEFRVSNKGEFKVPHMMLQNVLNKELYLNDYEKEAKKSFQSVLDQFEQKYEILIAKVQSYETENYDHFAELRRQIYLQKEV